jgi:hypothetical protein
MAVIVLSAHPAGATKLQVLPDGQVVVAQISPSESTAPVNGEIRGPDSQALVTAVAWPYEADGYVASTGYRLVAFTVELTEPTSDVTGFTATGTTLSLVVEGSPETLDETDISNSVAASNGSTGSGTVSYVASVPNTTKSVDLSMTDAGYTQAVSLWTLERTTPAPAVLYDDPTSSNVTEQLGIGKSISIEDPSLGSQPAHVFITSAMLSAFNPASTDSGALTGHAYLVLSMNATNTQGELGANNYVLDITPLPARAVTFTNSKHHRYVAERSDVTSGNVTPSNDGLLGATYDFLVPSDTTGGTVSIGPASTSGQTYLNYLNSGPFDSLQVGPVRFSVGFPSPPRVLAQPKPPWYGEPIPPTGLPGSGTGASSGLPVGGAVIVLALVVGVVLALGRRFGTSRDAETDDAEDVPAPQPVEVVPASSAAPSSGGAMRVGFMGSLIVTPVSEPLSEFGRSLVCFLAVHDDRPRSVDDAQTALWPTVGTESDISRKTFLNYVSEVRRIVGTAHFPENSRRAGYRLVNATTDWHDFRRQETEVARSSGIARTHARVAALSLVRGVPFESELSRWFQWADSEGLRTEITMAVVRMAVDAHAECVQAGDLPGAEWALRQGLKCNPGEFTLWACLADVVQARGDPNAIERYWRDATASLDPGSVAMLRDRVRG